jgi:membrane-bound lytic murein transglycosylase B
VRAADGGSLPRLDEASILVPAGTHGPALMIFRNFEVIERYNAADSYVIAVGHLSDRLRGGRDFVADWPRTDRALKRAEKEELQRRLTARGFDTQGVDGRIGPDTIAAIRRYQRAAGLVPDGYASPELLARLR